MLFSGFLANAGFGHKTVASWIHGFLTKHSIVGKTRFLHVKTARADGGIVNWRARGERVVNSWLFASWVFFSRYLCAHISCGAFVSSVLLLLTWAKSSELTQTCFLHFPVFLGHVP